MEDSNLTANHGTESKVKLEPLTLWLKLCLENMKCSAAKKFQSAGWALSPLGCGAAKKNPDHRRKIWNTLSNLLLCLVKPQLAQLDVRSDLIGNKCAIISHYYTFINVYYHISTVKLQKVSGLLRHWPVLRMVLVEIAIYGYIFDTNPQYRRRC